MSRKNKEWNLESMLSVVGFVFELVRVIVNALRKRNGTVDHLRRLLKEPALVDKVFDLIVDTNKQMVWPIWKTIKLGTGFKTADDFRAVLKQGGFKIGEWANNILGKPVFVVDNEETEVDLVKITVAELGFKDGATRQDICQRAKELGLELCPPEVGPQLRLQYKDQPLGEWLVIAMEPITVSDGVLLVFSVEHYDGGLWLFSNDGNPDRFWDGDDRFVFLRRK